MIVRRQRVKQGVIPKHAQIKIPYISPTYKGTQKKTQVSHLKEEIKFLYKKKDKLNESLYRTHLQAAREWDMTWYLIRDNINNTINLESGRMPYV